MSSDYKVGDLTRLFNPGAKEEEIKSYSSVPTPSLPLIKKAPVNLDDFDARIPSIDGSIEDEDKMLKKKYDAPKIKIDHTKDERNVRTLFLGNLDTKASKSMILKLCKPFGVVESLRFRSAAFSNVKMPKKAAFITKSFHESADGMNAYVVFVEIEAARKAAETLRNQVFMDRHLRTDIVGESNGQVPHELSVFVGNIPFDIKLEEFRNAFTQFGEIVDARLVRDKELNIGKGFGFVTFANKISVTEAIKRKASIGTRQLRVTKVSKDHKTDLSQAVSKAKNTLKREKLAPVKRTSKWVDEKEDVKKVKIQGAYQKAEIMAGRKLKKPRHKARESDGKIGGIIKPEAWMGYVATPSNKLSTRNNSRKKPSK